MAIPAPDELDGRALSAAVARYLFGLEVQERASAQPAQRDWLCREPGQNWGVVPDYSGNVGLSASVEAKLADLGWKQRESPLIRWPDPAKSAVVTLETEDYRMVAAGDSYPEALCRAALKAVQRGWTRADREAYARGVATADARHRAKALLARFQGRDPKEEEDWWLRGLETAREWLRLIESPSASQEEVTSLVAVAKANQRRNAAWNYMAMYIWRWADDMGYTVPMPEDYWL